MSRPAKLTLLTLLAACATAQDSAPRSEPQIFRWIVIGPAGRDTVRLGELLGASTRYALRTSDTTYQLQPGSFGGADSIELRVTPTGLVKEIHFTYSNRANLGEMIAAYAKDLGPGTTIQMTEGRDLTRWDDARTRFVIGTGGRAGPRVKAALIDLQLAR